MNDLIGLRYSWSSQYGDGTGAINCGLLAAEVHKRLGHYDYTDELISFLSKYTENTFSRLGAARWLLKNGVRLHTPEPHAVVLMPSARVGALGTVMNDGSILFIHRQFGVIIAEICCPIGHFFKLNK